MAGATEEHLDTDYSGRPYRMPSVEECLEYARTHPEPPPGTGIVTELPDGRKAILGKGGLTTGEWFVLGKDGWPDWDQPIDTKELNIKRPAAR